MATFDTDSEERAALRAAVHDVLEDLCAPDQVRSSLDDGRTGTDTRLWKALSSLGLPTLHVPEELGGQGGDVGDLAAAIEECGAALAPCPLLSVTVAVSLAAATGSPATPALLARAAASEPITIALAESGRGWLESPTTSAHQTEAGWAVTGTKCYVTDPAGAWLLVSASTPEGLGLFAVAPHDADVELQDALDLLRPLGTVRFASSHAELLIVGEQAERALLTWSHYAAVLLGAEQVGLARACLDLAVDYAKTRVQFGRPIGSFQAIKHLCADMLLLVEGARSLLWSATERLDGGADDDDETEMICATAAGYCADAAVKVAQDCLQIHGGIGFTWEHSCHLYLRRAKADELLLGSPTEWRERAVRVLERQVAAEA